MRYSSKLLLKCNWHCFWHNWRRTSLCGEKKVLSRKTRSRSRSRTFCKCMDLAISHRIARKLDAPHLMTFGEKIKKKKIPKEIGSSAYNVRAILYDMVWPQTSTRCTIIYLLVDVKPIEQRNRFLPCELVGFYRKKATTTAGVASTQFSYVFVSFFVLN